MEAAGIELGEARSFPTGMFPAPPHLRPRTSHSAGHGSMLAMAEQVTVTMVPVVTERPHRVEQWFYISVALLIILFNVVAFGPSIIDASRCNVPLPLTPLVTVHAVLSVVWLLLFLAQTTLVATGRTAIHRRVG